jgi:hypothetical protein
VVHNYGPRKRILAGGSQGKRQTKDSVRDALRPLRVQRDAVRSHQRPRNLPKSHGPSTQGSLPQDPTGRTPTQPKQVPLRQEKRDPEPTNKTQLRGFLGLTGYYRRFIEGYATLAEPLNRLLRNKEPYEWRAGQEQAFDTLSRSLTQAERNYDTTEREALAVVWAIKKLRHYRSGATHLNADALSRIPPQLTPAQQLVSHNSESRI